MLPDMTPAVERALGSAQRWAHRLGAAEVEPRHLLLGLLDEDEGRVAELLRGLEISLETARWALAGEGMRADPPLETPNLPLPGATQGALRAARRLGEEHLCDGTITSEALLLTLLRRDIEACTALRLELTLLEAAILPPPGPPLPLDVPLDLDDAPVALPTSAPPLPGLATWDIDSSRILDASANRAREGLRVVEDYCRFALDDNLLCDELKTLRHDLAAQLETVPWQNLLAARDTLQDVGTRLETAREGERASAREVAQINWKRVQEALRSLEEFGKVGSPELGRRIEGLRYRTYTLERAILLGAVGRDRLAQARLQVLVTESGCRKGLEATVQGALAGGAQVIQLREKNLSDADILARARAVRRWTQEAGALFILNDRPDLAAHVEADGVHLGQDDPPVRVARRFLGPDRLIGVSTHTPEQLRLAILEGASYVGVGPTFASGTKHFSQLSGLDYVRHAAQRTSLPSFVIGGIHRDTIATAVEAGARRVAVSQAVIGAEDPQKATAELLGALPR